MAPARPISRLEFEVTIICALTIEADSVKALFDQQWDDEPPHYGKAPGDPNAYSTGSIGSHNVVLTYLSGMGKVHAANAAAYCHASFPNIKLALVVGICGAVPFVPTTSVEIILGDVILSNGIIQYDLGRQYPQRFKRKDTLLESLGRPSVEIRTILQKLGGIHDRENLTARMLAYLEELQKKPALQASYPGATHDALFHATYQHPNTGKTCQECGCSGELVSRSRFEKGMTQPAVHFGLIASGDTVMKSGEERDGIAGREGVIGFEMEGAGIWDVFPCIVIKGVCDYADSHKTKMWQRYAAATAAACTKAFLEYWVSPAAASYTQQSPSPSFSLPFSLSEVTEVAHFVGRKQELTQMHSILGRTDGRRVVVLHGLGGIGKTQLVVAYSRTYRTHYSAVIWLNAKDKTSLQQSFARAAVRILQKYPALTYIQAATESRDFPTIIRAVHQWLDESDNDRWLLVVDNYDNPKLEMDDEDTEVMASRSDQETCFLERTSISLPFDIRPFFPDAYQGAIIITTRSSTVEVGNMISLKKLTDVHESLDILSSASHRQIGDHDQAAIELAKHLDGLPLALATAGSYLNQVPVSWAEYLQLYQQSWLQLQESSPVLLSYENRALYSTWNISYARVKHKSQAAAIMLHLWAYLDNEDVWYELLQKVEPEAPEWLKDTVQDRISFHKVMRVLCDHGLVEADSRNWGVDSRGYSVHECVHSWMIHALTPQKDATMVGLAIMCAAWRTPTREEPNYWLLQRRLLLHIDMCFVHISGKGSPVDGISEYLYRFGFLYADQGRFKEAENMYNRALQGYEKAWGPEHTSTLDIINNLGLLYADQGRFKEAEDIYNRALQGYEKAWGPEHISMLKIVNNLGNLYKAQGRFKEAEDMYNHALQGYEKALKFPMVDTYPPALSTIENLGDLLRDGGRLEESQKYYRRAEDGSRLVYGSESERYRSLSAKLRPHA